MVHPEDREGQVRRDLLTDSTLVPGLGGAGGSGGVTRVFGGRYELRGVLGRGGMGEVWLARDLKLQVEVALKALTAEKLGDEAAMARLRSEVRSARAVASPHVCRVYDLIEAEGVECVSMEYVDGITLRQVLDTRGPLELGEAREIALQLLAGLGAIHEAGLVHRDVKPDNVMITRSGRVVLMDFGIAKAVAAGGTVAGTPAYWAPEQALGEAADPRADVYATGIVLAEMVAPSGVRDWGQRQALWEALRDDPPKVPDTPWSEVIAKTVAKEPAKRYPSAQALARALEDVAHRVTGVEEAQPYPGLAAFTEADAEYFFGREAEVEEVWKRLPRRHLLALVGPSGAGKSSFLRAGLVPAKPESWAHLICTPGDAPFVALGQALVPEVSRDTDAMRQMLRFEDADVAVELFRRWRTDHGEALVFVDQLEELFTLNPAEVQGRFATLLSRLALEADVHVLLAMRDDFLLRCQEHEALRPVFEGLIPLGPPTGDALRRALVQPALKCGYRFEDESLVADMLQAVEGERGALPLLAFAAASLWHGRDREGGLLTRAAHDAIGGVAGALAQHAEATLERIGTDKLPLVRELFRNLVTAEGTRAVRDVNELLTVFSEGQRADAEAILKTLIDARLLTSYEAHGTEPREHTGRRVEVVHESLLTAWPRLVRWRTEDEGSAQLRDQLRQAAHLWQEKGRPEDLLWTGTSYQEYQVWRARYPGGLSKAEETFARAMAAAAGRRRRRRRIAVAAVIAALVAGLAVVGSFWRRSVQETRRAEAAQVLSLGRLRLADNPNIALAHAIASLEAADNGPARRFALEALWHGPPTRILADPTAPSSFALSSDGRWLVLASASGLVLYDRDTSERRVLPGSNNNDQLLGFTPDSARLVSRDVGALPRMVVRSWVLPEGRLERTLERAEAGARLRPVLFGDRLLTLAFDLHAPKGQPRAIARWLTLDGSEQEVLGRWEPTGLTRFDLDRDGTSILWTQPGRLLRHRLDALALPGQVIGSFEGTSGVRAREWRDRAVTGDTSGEVRIWDVPTARLVCTFKCPRQADAIALHPDGRLLAGGTALNAPPRSLFLFDLAAPEAASPLPLLTADSWLNQVDFSPDGSWLVTQHTVATVFWNLACPRSVVLAREEPFLGLVEFTRDGRYVLAVTNKGALQRWPLDPADGGPVELWAPADRRPKNIRVDPGGRFVAVGSFTEVVFVPLDGAKPWSQAVVGGDLWGWQVDPTGRYLAGYVHAAGRRDLDGLRIFDIRTGEERRLDASARAGEGCFERGSDMEGFVTTTWLSDGRLVTDGDAGLRLWDLASGGSELLRPCTASGWGSFPIVATPDSRFVLRLNPAFEAEGVPSSLTVFDLASRTTSGITSHGNQLWSMALDPSGTILVTGDGYGVVRAGSLSGEQPRLHYGHTAPVTSVAVSPDGRWIGSGSDDGTIRLWPMPDLSTPPLHTLPREELLAKLKSLTNLRAVRDPASDTGWKVEIGPFPGWATVPEWRP